VSVIWPTFKKELVSYLYSPVGYLIAVLLYLFRGFEISGLVKYMALIGGDVDQFATAYVLRPSAILMVVLVPPILTMRCFLRRPARPVRRHACWPPCSSPTWSIPPAMPSGWGTSAG
jgi:hypothetical protein